MLGFPINVTYTIPAPHLPPPPTLVSTFTLPCVTTSFVVCVKCLHHFLLYCLLLLQPARVSAHNVALEGSPRDKTVFLIKFDPEVLLREARLG